MWSLCFVFVFFDWYQTSVSMCVPNNECPVGEVVHYCNDGTMICSSHLGEIEERCKYAELDAILVRQGRDISSNCDFKTDDTSETSLIADQSTCGLSENDDRIIGGKDAGLDEFPWMALLEYQKSNGDRMFKCGGSLIGPRHILTAAHCVTGVGFRREPLVNVRLGEWNIDQEEDCVGKSCSDPPLNVGVDHVIAHPKFNPKVAGYYDDIAIVKLDKNVEYSDFVKPICLPKPGLKAATNEKLYVAGWGYTETNIYSPIKQKLSVPITGNEYCNAKFQRNNVTISEKQLCAGGLKDKDSCKGDSGGPLMHLFPNEARWYLEGVVSFGNFCGLDGWPGVYTRVVEYLDWIRANVK